MPSKEDKNTQYAMDSIKTAQMTAKSFNKSKAIIAGLIAKDAKTEKRFLSYDKEYGIYPVLAKVLYSPQTPQAILDEYPSDKKGDKVPAFAGELFERDKFSLSRLSTIKAEYDGSFFSLIQKTAIRLIQDKTRALNASVYSKLASIDECRELTSEDSLKKYEAHDLLKQIVADANLNEFQNFIIDGWIKGYEPKEIVEAYSNLPKNKQNRKAPYTMNYYYSQASKAMTFLKTAAQKY